MAEVKKTPSFFHPLIPPFDSLINAPCMHSSSSRNHTISMPSSPLLLTHIFLLFLISFFTIMSIFFFMVTLSASEYKQPSLLASLFGGDSNSTTILPSHPPVVLKMMSKDEAEFWKQEGGYTQPCLGFSSHYRKTSLRVSKEKRRFLRVIVSSGSGDLYLLRNQIIDAVLFSRILGAALLVPVLKKESGFQDHSEFADIFDVGHFKRTLRTDIRVVASHPYVHLTSDQVNGFELPHHVTPQWIRLKFQKQLSDDGVLMLNGIESKLIGKLPQDLLKLRCKVAFHALRFSNPIREIGYRLAKRLWIEGPYAAFDLGLNNVGHTLQFNAKHQDEQHLKTGLAVSDIERQIVEAANHLKGLGVPTSATLYATNAGAKPLGAAETLNPLIAEFPNLVSMEMVARAGELSPFVNSSYAMAAIDYTIALNSDVFLVSEDTNLSLAVLEHRAYTGKMKVINHCQPELRKTSNTDSRYEMGAYSTSRCGQCKRAFRIF